MFLEFRCSRQRIFWYQFVMGARRYVDIRFQPQFLPWCQNFSPLLSPAHLVSFILRETSDESAIFLYLYVLEGKVPDGVSPFSRESWILLSEYDPFRRRLRNSNLDILVHARPVNIRFFIPCPRSHRRANVPDQRNASAIPALLRSLIESIRRLNPLWSPICILMYLGEQLVRICFRAHFLGKILALVR